MIATGATAFANARVRALKSRLRGRELAARRHAGLTVARDQSTDPDAGFRELLEWYAVVLKSYPYGRPLVLALFARFEIENIKLVWRAAANGHDPRRWARLWLPLGSLAAVTRESCDDARTVQGVVEALRRTPYAAIAADMWRAHGRDPLAAEMGFDRWTSRRIIDAAAALAPADATTVALALALVHERDCHVLRRAAAGGLSPEIVIGALGLAHQDISTDEVRRLASWTPAHGPLAAVLPRRWQRHAPPAVDWEHWLVWKRRARRALCRRAFLESPYCLAPAVALLLLKEEEVRGLEAIAWHDGDADAAAIDYALAASELGA